MYKNRKQRATGGHRGRITDAVYQARDGLQGFVSVFEACITCYRTTIELVQAIESGEIDCAISSGAESASIIPVPISRFGWEILNLSRLIDKSVENGRQTPPLHTAKM